MKRPGQCDFGHCEKPAEVLLVSLTEKRPMCEEHANYSIQLMPEFKLTKVPLPRKP